MRIGQAFSRVLNPDGEVLFHNADTPLDLLLEEAWHPSCLSPGPQTPDQVSSSHRLACSILCCMVDVIGRSKASGCASRWSVRGTPACNPAAKHSVAESGRLPLLQLVDSRSSYGCHPGTPGLKQHCLLSHVLLTALPEGTESPRSSSLQAPTWRQALGKRTQQQKLCKKTVDGPVGSRWMLLAPAQTAMTH